TLFEGALFNSWATNVLKNGIEVHSYSIEKALLDIDEYFMFTGMMVNGLTLTLATSSIAKGSFDFLGAGATLTQTTGATVVTAATSTEIMNCMGNVASLKEGSSLTTLAGIYVQELSFSIANNLRPVYQIGSNIIGAVAVGKMDITGTLNAYFANDRLFDQFLAGSATAIEFTIEDAAGNDYTVLFPRVKFESESVVAPGQDQDVIETLTWRALRDPTYNAMIHITRVVA
ncbi:MAG TPA: phage tail tube protein, partial [Desulfobacterales bacterium]|nr:phage tail tube protein [Desulfobacterales bacterium]